MRPAQGQPNDVAPQGFDFEKWQAYSNWELMKEIHALKKVKAAAKKKVTQWNEVTALGLAFVFPTVASGVNTFSVAHQLAQKEAVAWSVLCMVSLTPILFILGKMQKIGVFVALAVVIFEGFCNVAATYLSLMGGMVYIFGAPRGDCSAFLQNVVELTESGHKQTALGIAIFLAVIVSAVQLTAFWGLKKRF